jgi:hypothetical protein
MKNFILAAAVALLAACAIPQQGAMKGDAPPLFAGLGVKRTMAAQQQPAPQTYVDEVLDVVTEPAGARIMINDASVGYAPLRYSVRRLWRGAPGRMTLDTVKVEALPVAAGQCVQSGIYGQNNLKVPSPVRFVMTNCAPVSGK